MTVVEHQRESFYESVTIVEDIFHEHSEKSSAVSLIIYCLAVTNEFSN